MRKTERAPIRITAEQKEKIKKLGKTYSEIFDEGYNQIIQKSIEEVANLRDKYQKLYIHYEQMYIQLNNEKDEKDAKLDIISKNYIKSGRSIDQPTAQDRFWLKSRCEKENINPQLVLNRCKILKDGE